MPVILFVIFAVLLIILGPFLTIWSLNTLFPILAIGYGISEWFAALILGSVVGGRVVFPKRK